MTDAMKQRLLDALTACQAIASFTGGLEFEDYEVSELARSAVERKLEIVGEALHRAEEEDAALVERLPDLRQIVGMRNRIIHGYDSVDDEIVWDVVQSKIPALREKHAALLADNGNDAA